MREKTESGKICMHATRLYSVSDGLSSGMFRHVSLVRRLAGARGSERKTGRERHRNWEDEKRHE